MMRRLKLPVTQQALLVTLAILAEMLGFGCKSPGRDGPREGIYTMPAEAGYSNGLVNQRLLSADQGCLPASDPAPLDAVANIAISGGTGVDFTIHRLSEGETWAEDAEGIRCSQNEFNEFRCMDEEREVWSTFGDYFVYGWVLSPEELFGIWLDWTVEDAESWDCAAQSTWVAEWSAELPD